MDLQHLQAISDKLEELKSRGDVSDYLVCGSGPAGDLTPRVTVWNSPAQSWACGQERLREALAELVRPDRIEIVVE